MCTTQPKNNKLIILANMLICTNLLVMHKSDIPGRRVHPNRINLSHWVSREWVGVFPSPTQHIREVTTPMYLVITPIDLWCADLRSYSDDETMEEESYSL